MARINPAFLDELRTRTKLSAVIGPTVKLIKAGREYKACCPFHPEKTPSFTVNDEKGFYHCFGCGAHGDAIRFLTDHEGLAFLDAVKKLAEMAGMSLPKSTSESSKGGAKLSRSETVTVRLDPKLNYLCELAARAQRRTKSSYIEWAIADSLGSVPLPDVVDYGDSFGDVRSVSIQEKSHELWHVDEPDRLVALATTAPALLNHDEQLIWKYVRENGFVWKGKFDEKGEWSWSCEERYLIRDRLRDHWETFKGVALGDVSKDDLPTWARKQSKPAALDTDLDDDVPF